MATSAPTLVTNPIVSPQIIVDARKLVNQIYVDDAVKDYIVELIHATREPEAIDPKLKLLIRCGSSPRGTINLTLAAKASAFLNGRAYVTPSGCEGLRHGYSSSPHPVDL